MCEPTACLVDQEAKAAEKACVLVIVLPRCVGGAEASLFLLLRGISGCVSPLSQLVFRSLCFSGPLNLQPRLSVGWAMFGLPSFYTKYYCEENIYHFLLALRRTEAAVFDERYAVVASSYRTAVSGEVANRWSSHVPFRPFNSDDSDDLMLWDYHVIAVVRSASTKVWFVVDFDSNLCRLAPVSEDLGEWTAYCTRLDLYVKKTFFFEDDCFRHFDGLDASADRIGFRVMEEAEYLSSLRTTRSHMLNKAGNYSAPPPPGPPISSTPAEIPDSYARKYSLIEGALDERRKQDNLVCFINMNNTLFPGDIVDRHHFAEFFASLP